MPLFGPRLDRPSAIGDEGRPRAASLTVASLAVVGFALALGWTVELGSVLRTVAVGIGFVGLGMGLFDRDSFAALAIAHVCFLPGGVILLGGVATAAAHPVPELRVPLVVVSLGLAIAAVGLAGGWTDAIGDRGLTTATVQGWAGVVVPVVVLAVGGVLALLGWLGWAVVVRPSLVPRAGPAVSGLFFAAAVGAVGIVVALWQLPLVRLAPRDRRPAVAEWRRRGLLVAGAIAAGSLVGWAGLAVLEAVGVTADLYRAVPAVEFLLSLTATPLVRVPLAAVGVAGLLAAVASLLVRFATSDLRGSVARALAPAVSVLGLLGIPVPFLTRLFIGISRSPPQELVGLLLLAVGAFVVVTLVAAVFMLVFSLAPLAGWLGFVPERAGPGALAAFGMLIATVGAALGPLSPLLVFAGAAATVVVWDLSEFGAGLTREVGHLPETRRLELLHAVGSLGVAAVALAAVAGLYALVDALGGLTTPAPGAVVLAVAGVLVLFVPLRD